MMRLKVRQKGQAVVTLLVFVSLAIIVTGGAVAATIVNTKSAGSFALSQESYQIAEAGVETGIEQLLRNPSYTGETITIGQGTATITVSGTNPKTITSQGSVGSAKRTLAVTGTTTNTVFTTTSWTEQ